jgi:hypothetical protein
MDTLGSPEQINAPGSTIDLDQRTSFRTIEAKAAFVGPGGHDGFGREAMEIAILKAEDVACQMKRAWHLSARDRGSRTGHDDRLSRLEYGCGFDGRRL